MTRRGTAPPPDLLSWLWQAVETMQLGVTVTDLEGRIVYTNPAEAAMHGYAVDELLGKPVRLFAPKRRRPRRISGAEMQDAALWDRETVNARKDGTVLPVRLVSDVIRSPDGEPIGLVTVSEDLTEREGAEARLRQAQKMEVMGQLTGGIAHDFNNVLTVIVANLDFLATATPAQAAEVWDVIDETQRVARQGTAMARQLLAFSRPTRLEFLVVNLVTLLREYVGVLRRVLPEHIEIRLTSETDVPPAVADPHGVQEILLNLATNARDVMSDGGLLRVHVMRALIDDEFRATHGWGRPGPYVAVTVSDTGAGMDEATRRRIFEPFFTTKGEERGTGLGLAMVYALMKQHRGFVHVYSEPQEGTTFKLWFPEAPDGSAAEVLVDDSAPARRGGTETILVVEDEAPIRRAAERTLRRFGYTVVTAVDGADGYDQLIARRERIDLVLSDVVMPRLGGQDLLARAQAAGITVPFVFTSGYTRADIRSGLDLEKDVPILQKPWTVSELLRSVRLALDGVKD